MEERKPSITPRHRISLSCQECKRLKLKCDRSFPCANCVRRNCGQICPTGTLQPSGRISKATQQLALISQRVIDLEAILKSNGLQDSIPEPVPAIASGSGIKKERKEYALQFEDLVGGVGSLTIKNEDQSTRYLGMSSGSAYFANSDSSYSSDNEDTPSPASSPAVAPIVTTYNFTKSGSTYPVSLGDSKFKEIEHIRSFLPLQEEGRRLASNYWNFVSFMFEPLQENQFWDDYFVSAYTAESGNGTKLACTFIILALGSLFDPLMPPTFNALANQYFLLSQTALSAARFLSQNTIAAAITIHLTGNFLFNTHKLQDGGETFFCLLGLGLRMVPTIGLHRDGLIWNIAEPELERRRLLFYEMMTLDRLQSFIAGRPYVIRDLSFDTKMPTEVDDYQISKFKLAKLLGKITDEAFSIAVPAYATILSLDQELRHLYQTSPVAFRSTVLPEYAFVIKPTGPPILPAPKPSSATVKIQMRQYTLDMFFSQISLYLHKPPFAQALIQYPEEPLNSPFSASVIAVCLEASVYILALAKNWIKIDPVLCPRWWHIYFHAFAASVAQSSLISTCPESILSQHAWNQLNEAVTIFENASIDGAPVVLLLPRVQALRNNAYLSLQSVLTLPQVLQDPHSNSPASEPSPTATDDSIAALGASTHLLRKARKNSRLLVGEGNNFTNVQFPPSLPENQPSTSIAPYIPYNNSSYSMLPNHQPFIEDFTPYTFASNDTNPRTQSQLPYQQELINRELTAQSLLQQHQSLPPILPLNLPQLQSMDRLRGEEGNTPSSSTSQSYPSFSPPAWDGFPSYPIQSPQSSTLSGASLLSNSQVGNGVGDEVWKMWGDAIGLQGSTINTSPPFNNPP